MIHLSTFATIHASILLDNFILIMFMSMCFMKEIELRERMAIHGPSKYLLVLPKTATGGDKKENGKIKVKAWVKTKPMSTFRIHRGVTVDSGAGESVCFQNAAEEKHD